MTYTSDFIKNTWLVEGSVPYSENQVVDAFNEIQNTLGKGWLDRIKFSNGTEMTGPYVTIVAVELGLKLQVLKKGENYDSLITKLLSQNEIERIKGLAELDAICFFCITNDIVFELEPQVSRPGKTSSHPDFRVKKINESEWTYVEVKQPDMSEENKSVQIIIEKIQKLFSGYNNYISLELMLLHIPTEEEISLIENKCSLLFSQADKKEIEIEGLGMIKINYTETILYSPSEYHGFTDKPVFATLNSLVEKEENGIPTLKKLIACRIAVSDERASRFLINASEQLSDTSPNLIWIDGKNVPSIKNWANLINKQFRDKPALNRKVSGLVTFFSGIGLNNDIISVITSKALIENETSNFKIPDWIIDKLK